MRIATALFSSQTNHRTAHATNQQHPPRAVSVEPLVRRIGHVSRLDGSLLHFRRLHPLLGVIVFQYCMLKRLVRS
jgi:hypothetical protein